MPKKGGKGKKKKEDEWGSIPRETFTTVAVRNSQWHHMQFDLVLPTSTRFGAVDVKLGVLGGRVVTVHPEYEDCRARAAAARVPVRRVMHAALATALSALPPEESGLAEVPRRPA